MPHPTTTRCPSKVVRSPPASASLRARLGNRPALRGERHSRPCPPLRLCIAPRLGPASSAYVLLPAQVSRLRRLPFAAVAHSGCAVCPSRRFAYTASALGTACWKVGVRRAGRFLAAARTPLRQMGCCPLVLVRGWWWGVGSARSRSGRAREGRTGLRRRRRAPARPPRARSVPSRPPATTDRARAPAGAPTPTTSRPRPTHPRRSAPWPRPRRTTWRGTPSHARAPPPPRPCPAASRQSCP